MNTLYFPEQQDLVNRDMAPTTSLAFSLFISSFVAGFYIYDLFKKSKVTEGRLGELEHVLHETATVQESHSDILQEHDQRIREKQDYNEGEEVQHGKYQAWQGIYTGDHIDFRVEIVREKESTVQKNASWIYWDRSDDGSCTVRDFYLGNSHPDFSWEIQSGSDNIMSASVSDTLINGWDSLVKIKMILVASEDRLVNFTGSESFVGNSTLNVALKKMVDDKKIQWNRILLDI